MALGADRGEVLRLMMGRGMSSIFVGLGIGLVAALALTRLIAGMLFAVRPTDPVALGGAAIALVAVAMLAIFIPAWRATTVNPMVALRYE
jgi:ABC-type antimicrobial peptide transport system permease subunit